MKPNQRIFELLNNYNYYLPQQLDKVCIEFYEQMVINLGLPDNVKKSFISQISKISSIAQDENQFRFLVQTAWKGLLNKVEHHQLFSMKDQKEMKDFQEFVEKVVFEPKKYEQKFVDELMKIYETYFQSNGGIAQIIQRNRVRMIICKLIWSKFIRTYDEQVQKKLEKFFDEIYAKKIEKFEQQAPLMIDFLSEDNFFGKIFDVIFDEPNQQGICFNSLKYLVQIAAQKYRNNMSPSIDLVMKFHQIYIDKEKFLFEKFEQSKPYDERYVDEIITKVQGNDLKDYLEQLVSRFNQTSDYRKIMQELITKDIYNKQCDQQQLLSFIKEFDQIQQRRRPLDRQLLLLQERHKEAVSKLIVKLKLTEKIEKNNTYVYSSNFYELIIFQQNNIILKNLQTNYETTFRNTEQIEQFIRNLTI